MTFGSDLPDAASRPVLYRDAMLSVHSCQDFDITGLGDSIYWKKASWIDMEKLDKGGRTYKSQFKILYSAKGIYVLFNAEDQKISSHFEKDFDRLYKGDVFEVFFHPDPGEPIYFEYEISPLGKELVLFMLNRNGIISGWKPWPYENEMKVQKQVVVFEGKMNPGAAISSWTSELFFPYSLLSPFRNVPPEKGVRWNANFCRLDYDTSVMIKWAWAPVSSSFHELDRYYCIRFE